MVLSKSQNPHRSKLFQRKSLLGRFKSKHRLKDDLDRGVRFKRKSRTRHYIKHIYRTYQSLCLTVSLIFRLFIVIDKMTREIFLFIDKLIQIIRVIHGWICLIRSILSALHLITSRIMMLSSKVHRIFHLLSILLEPFSNRTFEKGVRSFSHFLFHYYSSNGACYTLQARTRHIVGRVRERWKRNHHYINEDSDIYYDAFEEAFEWF